MVLSDAQFKSLLIKNKILDEKEVVKLESVAANSRLSLQEAALENQVLSQEECGQLVAKHIKLPYVSLAKRTLSPELLSVLPEQLARSQKMVVFDRDIHTLKVASSALLSDTVITSLSQKTGLNVETYLATDEAIERALRSYRHDLERMIKDLLAPHSGVLSDAPIASIVDLLIMQAFRDRASDIHIEPEEGRVLIRFRIDSILQDVLTLDRSLLNRIVTRIKVLSRLPTDEHVSALDGKFGLTVDGSRLDVRVSIIPVVDGEKVVLRLLSTRFQPLSLTDLGMSAKDLEKVHAAIAKSYGMVLSTGPTGSGKTTSIYSIVKIVNTRDRNITTIEDPIEYRISGVNQIQYNSKTNLSFASGLRAILRQDPNVIFVGEIRDNETAGVAVNAALTGHLVLSTLHTNNAATTLPRLIDMGIEPFLVASTVNLIIAQRLVRRICPDCKESFSVTHVQLSQSIPEKLVTSVFGHRAATLYRGKGCVSCHHSGYVGRIGIFEVMELTESIQELISKRVDADTIQRAAIASGMTTMVEDGLAKVKAGITTLEEVLRVTKVESL